MNEKKKVGNFGEELASEYIKKRGYKIIERNYREKWGELDSVAKTKEKALLCIEVKTMKEGELKPEDQMSAGKIERFRRAAEMYANTHEELFDIKKGYRLDLITIILKNNGEREVKYYENIY